MPKNMSHQIKSKWPGPNKARVEWNRLLRPWDWAIYLIYVTQTLSACSSVSGANGGTPSVRRSSPGGFGEHERVHPKGTWFARNEHNVVRLRQLLSCTCCMRGGVTSLQFNQTEVQYFRTSCQVCRTMCCKESFAVRECTLIGPFGYGKKQRGTP
jgi:hypothetical protein